MTLRNPWPERGPGRPRRTDPFVMMRFRISGDQVAIAERLAKRPGWPKTPQAVIKQIIDLELQRLGELPPP